MSNNRVPLGRLVGLLAGCLVTLIGVVCNLAPDVILNRAAVAAVVLGVATRLVQTIVVYLMSRTE